MGCVWKSFFKTESFTRISNLEVSDILSAESFGSMESECQFKNVTHQFEEIYVDKLPNIFILLFDTTGFQS